MGSRNEDDVDMSDIKIELETDLLEPTEVVTKVKSKLAKKQTENDSASPLEDRTGRSLWVQTRICYCPNDAPTDCRFHGQEEAGWEVCPYSEQSKKNRHLKGRWLWARNPFYGRTMEENESKELEVEETVTQGKLLPVAEA